MEMIYDRNPDDQEIRVEFIRVARYQVERQKTENRGRKTK